MSQWRPMASAPKDKVILVTETPNGEHFNVVEAFWGRPKGFKDEDAGWWGISFATSAEVMFDLPELRARLIAITPLCWRPLPVRASERIIKIMNPKPRKGGVYVRGEAAWLTLKEPWSTSKAFAAASASA